MISLLLAAAIPAGLPSIGPAEGDDAAVRLWINSNGRFRPGEAVRVQVEAGSTGYLLVLQYDPDGNLRVLFPLSPLDDQFVQAGRRYEVRDYDHSQSFVADGSGPGLIYAAVSGEPWRFDGFTAGEGWDYGVLTIPGDSRDPEADLTALVQGMSGPSGFDYDVEPYLVIPVATRHYDGPPPPSWWSPIYYSDLYYDPYYPYYLDCIGCYRSRFFIHLGYGSPFWYYPSYWYRPWYFSYYRLGGFYTPYWAHRGFSPGRPVFVVPRDNIPTIVGRSRGYGIERRSPFGARGGAGSGFDRRGDGSGVGAAAPSGEARPPARRARGERPSADRPAARPPTGQSAGTPSGGTAGRPSGGTAERPSSGGSQGTDRSRARGGRPRGGSETAAAGQNATVYAERERPSGGVVRQVGSGAKGQRGESVRRARGVERVSVAGPVERPEARRSDPERGGPTIQRGEAPRVERVGTPSPRSVEPVRARGVGRPEARRSEPRSEPARIQTNPVRVQRSDPARVSRPAARGVESRGGDRSRAVARPSQPPASSRAQPSRPAVTRSQPSAPAARSQPAPSAKAPVARSGGNKGSTSRGGSRSRGRP